MNARVGPLRFMAAPVQDGTEPAGALVDELLRTGSADLPLPKLTVALLSNERHILAATGAAPAWSCSSPPAPDAPPTRGTP